jgi:hypothetical protein
MNRIPKIGERVRYEGSSVVGPCIGIVKRIYPALDPAPGQDESDDDCRYVKAPFDPERWQVAMEVEGDLPSPFVYPNTKQFAPAINEIEPVQPQTATETAANHNQTATTT